jgi:MoaA/NifB/PqqE/SkfB family radical SAM enzyme
VGCSPTASAWRNLIISTSCCNPDEEQSWEALRDLLAEDISVTVHLTVTTRNSLAIPALLDRFELMGVKLISLSVDDPVLKETLTALRQLTAEKGLSLVWDLPVPYSRFHPVAFETAEGEQVQGAGKAWLYIEPDGDVLPGQGIDQVMGNFLNDDWDAIWAKRPR